MLNSKVVRSTVALLALCGAFTACSSGSNEQPAAAPGLSNDGLKVLSQEVTQKASVKIASVTDADGKPVALSAAPSLTRLREINNAIVTKEAIEVSGQISQRMTIDLRGTADSVVKFQAETDMTALALASDFPASHAEAAISDGKIRQMLVRVNDGSVVNVVLAFGVQQEQAKQEQAKQEQAKQEQVKQAQEQVKQAQEQVKQEQPKQEQVKQAQEQVKQAQEQVKQAQEQVKQEQPKQEQVKQAQEQVKQAQEQVKQAQEQVKQEQPKQEQVKQAQEQVKQAQEQPKQK